MKYLINENKLNAVVNKFMTNEFNKLTKFKSKVFPTGVFYLDGNGNIIAEVINTKHVNAVVLDWKMWNFVNNLFGFDRIPHQQEVLSKWADEYFGLENTLIDFRDFVESVDDL